MTMHMTSSTMKYDQQTDIVGADWYKNNFEGVNLMKKGNITANWHPDTKTIEVMRLIDGTVKSRLFYATKYLAKSLKDFDPIENR